MEFINLFITYLQHLKNTPSKSTIKNYRADLIQFVRWFEEEYKDSFTPSLVTRLTIEAYKESKLKNQGKNSLALTSVNRHISSLRKFFSFLVSEDIISLSPFDSEETQKQPETDTWHLKAYTNYLRANKISDITIKNYLIDLKQFFSWAEIATGSQEAWDLSEKDIFKHITPQLVELYKARLKSHTNFSPASINRKLSSLRRFIVWAVDQNLLPHLMEQVNFQTPIPEPVQQPSVPELLPLTASEKAFDSLMTTAKSPEYSSFPPLRLVQKILRLGSFGLDVLLVAQLAAFFLLLQKQLIAIKGLSVFDSSALKNKGLASTDKLKTPKKITSNPVLQVLKQPDIIKSSFYAPTSTTQQNNTFFKKALYHIRYTRPAWYKTYHKNPLVAYFHFAVLAVLLLSVGTGLYNSFFKNQLKVNASYASGFRVLSFNGTLTDAKGLPISGTKQVRFILYNDSVASGSAKLWEEVRTVTPNADGQFHVLLGSDGTAPATPCLGLGPQNQTCGLPQALFANNTSVWLGVSLGASPELSPRQQIQNVSYAHSADEIQGLLPTTDATSPTANALLALDSSGNLTIGSSANPVLKNDSGTFTLSGQQLVLTTSDISLIDLQKPLQNSTTNNNLLDAQGAVEVDDMFAVLATSSAEQSAVTIEQDGSGPFISASSSGEQKFLVDANGNVTQRGDLLLSGSSPIVSAQGAENLTLNQNSLGTVQFFNAQNNIAPNGRLTLAGSIIQTGEEANIFSGLITADKGLTVAAGTNLTLSGVSSGLLYTDSSGVVKQVAQAASANMCLLSGTQGPSWGQCPTSTTNTAWQQTNGTVSPVSTSSDMLVGGTSTQSASFSIQGIAQSASVNGYDPVASLSALLSKNGNGNGLVFDSKSSSIQSLLNNTLTFGGQTTGNIAFSPANTQAMTITSNGNVGIGTKTPSLSFSVEASKDATSAAQIYNSSTNSFSSALALKLGSTGPNNSFLTFLDQNGNEVARVDGTGAFAAPNQDLAEYFQKLEPKEEMPAGTLVCESPLGGATKCTKDLTSLLGVVSEHPGFIGGVSHEGDSSYVLLGLVGQLPVNVASGSAISPGDYLTVGQTPGTAEKAETAGYIVGQAIESSNGKASVRVAVHPTWYDPTVKLAKDGNLNIVIPTVEQPTLQNTVAELQDNTGYTINNINNIGAFSKALIANLQAGFISAESITTKALAITTDNVSIAGVGLKQYISDEVQAILNEKTIVFGEVVSPIASINELHTNLISPVGDSSISLKLQQNKIAVTNSKTQQEVASIDDSGNASFSGKLNSNDLTVQQDATVSGTLHAGKIIASEIEGLATQSAQYITNVTNIYQTATVSASPTPTPSTEPVDPSVLAETGTQTPSTNPAPLTPFQESVISAETVNGKNASFEGNLVAFGPTTLSDTAVTGQLSVGHSLTIADNSINVIGGDLALQPLRQGNVTFEGGLVAIDTQGNLNVEGNAYFAKNVTVNGVLSTRTISPIDQGGLDVTSSTGSGVIHFDQEGNIQASGSGSFSDLLAKGLSIVRSAQADTSSTETVAQSSAGTAVIKAGQLERTIITPYVKAGSLIYITPTNDTQGVTPFLARQTVEDTTRGTQASFTIEIPETVKFDITLNWWIVN